MQEKYRAVLWVFMHFLTGSAKSNSFYLFLPHKSFFPSPVLPLKLCCNIHL